MDQMIEDFTCGACLWLAWLLNRKFGFPINAIVLVSDADINEPELHYQHGSYLGLVHAWVNYRGKAIDITGMHDENKFVEEWFERARWMPLVALKVAKAEYSRNVSPDFLLKQMKAETLPEEHKSLLKQAYRAISDYLEQEIGKIEDSVGGNAGEQHRADDSQRLKPHPKKIVPKGNAVIDAGTASGWDWTDPSYGQEKSGSTNMVEQREEFQYITIPAGTHFFHGTSSPFFDERADDLDAPAWVSDSYHTARNFVTWHDYEEAEDPHFRVIFYKTTAPLTLLLFENRSDIEEFEDITGLDLAGTIEFAEGVCDLGFDGWHIPHNYPDGGSDTLICRPNVLQYQDTEVVE